MRTPARWLRAAALSAAVALAAPLFAMSSAPANEAEAAGDTTFTPKVVSLSSAEIANPHRGQYRWMGQASQPSTWPAPDLYDRDKTYWGRLEATKGQYDFSAIEAGLRDAESVNGKYGFRVMAYCPGCWMEGRAGWPSVVPPWMPKDEIGAPWWNSETFLSSWEALWAELGKRYANDPRLGYVDVGGYGKYGEWMTPANKSYVTEANTRRIIDAVAKAFPKKHVLMGAVAVYTKSATLQAAMEAHPNLGLRSDCLGKSDMQVPHGAFSEYWKTRPFFTEWCTTGDPVIAKPQVTTHHVSTISSGNLNTTYDKMTSEQRSAYQTLVKSSGYRYALTKLTLSPVSPGQPVKVSMSWNNAGVAPTYDPWKVRLVLTDGSGARAATLPLSLDLQTRLPGASTFSQTVTVPSIPNGQYGVAVEVVDPSGYLSPMRLANTGRTSAGTYPLGSVSVGAAQAGHTVQRLSGADRYEASAAISAATFEPGVPVAYVATGGNFPDALSGAPVAGKLGGPVLLVKKDAVPVSIGDELTRLQPKKIVVLGGPNSVSSSTAKALAEFTTGSVTRLAGADRYEASANISASVYAPGVDVAYVATGANFPDALSGAPVAGKLGGPVLLVQTNGIPASIRAELTRLQPKKIVVLGGPNSVSTSTAQALSELTTGSVTRISGADRYEASANISASTYAPGVPVVYVATGGNFPDALSGAPVAGKLGGPVLLVQTNGIPASIKAELTRLQPAEIVVLGGPNSVSSSTASALGGYVTP